MGERRQTGSCHYGLSSADKTIPFGIEPLLISRSKPQRLVMGFGDSLIFIAIIERVDEIFQELIDFLRV